MKFRLLVFFATIFFGSVAFLAGMYKSQVVSNADIKTGVKIVEDTGRKYVIKPILSLTSSYPTFSASSVIAVDLDTGTSLYEKQPDQKLLPASTTKIITALVALDYYPLDKVIKVNLGSVDGQKMGLKNGEQIDIRNLLYGLLLYSANDAAEVLAENYPGGKTAFIDMMNAKAKELDLENSYFRNPQGYEDMGHLSTARDLIKAASVGMKNDLFARIVATKQYTATSVDGKITHRMVNLNTLLGKIDGVLGVKTGWTENAKENLVTEINRDGHNIMIVVLGSNDRFGETERLIDWIYSSYAWRNVPVSYLSQGAFN